MAHKSALQDWVFEIPQMQQSVLMSGIRGMDGLAKKHPAKALIKFYRRSILVSAFDGKAILTPYNADGETGGEFTGPSINIFKDHNGNDVLYDGDDFVSFEEWPKAMKPIVNNFLLGRDEMPLHYYTHMMHSFQIVGFKHPDTKIRLFWRDIYWRMVYALHLWPESEQDMDKRLGDDETNWRARSDEAGSCQT